MKERLFRLTPLGRADHQIREFLEDKLDKQEFEQYNKTLMRYRNFKLVQQTIRALFYASAITSIATVFNLDLSIIAEIASYLGFTLLLVLYVVFTYLTMLYREDYYVQRDIVLATAKQVD